MTIKKLSKETCGRCECKPCPNASVFLNDIKDEFDDILQGDVPNCCLIASLSAVDWTLGRNKINSYRSGESYKVFLKGNYYSVTENLALDANWNYCFAHSRVLSEIWPGIYEKAVAKYIHNYPGDCCMSEVKWDGNPNRYLVALTKCTLREKTSNFSTEISNRCIKGKVKYPMVLWSPDHCVTVLGQRADGTFVLRDPLGENPSLNGAITTGYFSIGDHFTLDCVSDNKLGSYGSYSKDLGAGIFALPGTLLGEYFSHLSYVGKP